MIDRLTAGSMATAGVVIGFFIMQSWAGSNKRKPEYWTVDESVVSPQAVYDGTAQAEYSDGTKKQGATIPYDVKAGSCPSGYQKEYLNYGSMSVPVCREILQA